MRSAPLGFPAIHGQRSFTRVAINRPFVALCPTNIRVDGGKIKTILLWFVEEQFKCQHAVGRIGKSLKEGKGMRDSEKIRFVLRQGRAAPACAVTACLLGFFARSAAAAYISEDSAVPIAPGQAYTLDGTVATHSDLGWDLSFIDHSAFSVPYFADDLSGSAYFVGPTDSTPYFTTFGGENNPGLATNQPFTYVGFDNGYLLTAGVPELFTIWLNTDGPAEIDASLADGSVSLDPVDFSSPTEFQIEVESDTTQEVDFSAPASDNVQDGLWAISATAAVPEPSFLGLPLIGGAVLLARRRWFSF